MVGVSEELRMNVIISQCELCDKPLNEDEVYGPEDMDLCREHHEKFYQLLNFMVTGKISPDSRIGMNEKTAPTFNY